MASSTCRDCGAPIVWQNTDQGRRPFDADGTLHFKSCGQQSAGRQTSTHDHRLAVLELAVTFAVSRPDVKAVDVVKIATIWEQWLRGDD